MSDYVFGTQAASTVKGFINAGVSEYKNAVFSKNFNIVPPTNKVFFIVFEHEGLTHIVKRRITQQQIAHCVISGIDPIKTIETVIIKDCKRWLSRYSSGSSSG